MKGLSKKQKRERELTDMDNVVMVVGRKGMGGGGREHTGDEKIK